MQDAKGFFSDFFAPFKLTIKNVHYFLVEQGRESGDNRAKRYRRRKGRLREAVGLDPPVPPPYIRHDKLKILY